MKKYQVEIRRTGYSCKLIEVKARNKGEAQNKALIKAASSDFSETDSRYEVITVIEGIK